MCWDRPVMAGSCGARSRALAHCRRNIGVLERDGRLCRNSCTARIVVGTRATSRCDPGEPDRASAHGRDETRLPWWPSHGWRTRSSSKSYERTGRCAPDPCRQAARPDPRRGSTRHDAARPREKPDANWFVSSIARCRATRSPSGRRSCPAHGRVSVVRIDSVLWRSRLARTFLLSAAISRATASVASAWDRTGPRSCVGLRSRSSPPDWRARA